MKKRILSILIVLTTIGFSAFAGTTLYTNVGLQEGFGFGRKSDATDPIDFNYFSTTLRSDTQFYWGRHQIGFSIKPSIGTLYNLKRTSSNISTTINNPGFYLGLGLGFAWNKNITNTFDFYGEVGYMVKDMISQTNDASYVDVDSGFFLTLGGRAFADKKNNLTFGIDINFNFANVGFSYTKKDGTQFSGRAMAEFEFQPFIAYSIRIR